MFELNPAPLLTDCAPSNVLEPVVAKSVESYPSKVTAFTFDIPLPSPLNPIEELTAPNASIVLPNMLIGLFVRQSLFAKLFFLFDSSLNILPLAQLLQQKVPGLL